MMLLPAPRALARPLAACALALLGACALAASPTTGLPPADLAQAGPVRTYTTVAGDTMDRVIQKNLGHSPLKTELLRQAMVQANPQGLPAGRNPRFRPGTVLNLPDHDALLRAVVLPVLQPAEAGALAGAAAPADARKRWVRYP